MTLIDSCRGIFWDWKTVERTCIRCDLHLKLSGRLSNKLILILDVYFALHSFLESLINASPVSIHATDIDLVLTALKPLLARPG